MTKDTVRFVVSILTRNVIEKQQNKDTDETEKYKE